MTLKTTLTFTYIVLLIVLLAACGREQREAKAIIKSASGSSLTGEATFVQTHDGVSMNLTVENATPGTHAVHLHQNGDCSAPDATSAGGHWNPTEEKHGNREQDSSYHLGDIANLEVNENGRGTLLMNFKDWSIGDNQDSDILGKAVIVHAKADDFVSQPAGNAGDRIGCGVIELSE